MSCKISFLANPVSIYQIMTQNLDANIIASYLQNNPSFFNEYTELLANIRLNSPILGKAISLHERQIEVIREKNKSLERQIAELIRIARENDSLMINIQNWTRSILKTTNDLDRAKTLITELASIFSIPYVTLRLWNTKSKYNQEWFVQNVSETIRLFAQNLQMPYCGKNNDNIISDWLEKEISIASVALIPLKTETETFGLLVLGSPDEARFRSDMATDFLSEIAKTASAALICLINP